MKCASCGFPGADLQLAGCGCLIHAKCAPMAIFAAPDEAGQLAPTVSGASVCSFCSSTVSSVKLFPLTTRYLDEAIECRKLESAGRKKNLGSEDEIEQQIQAESSYLLLSHTHSSKSSGGEGDFLRSGRWSDEELHYVDFLLGAFEKGQLCLPLRVRLNDFLAELLLCKHSRLTKKLKNMRLSSRTFEPNFASAPLDVVTMSALEEKFLCSVTNKATRLELTFHMTKTWRNLLSNFCVGVGNSLLDVSEWVQSLEHMEARASEAEALRLARRRHRMGLALKTDLKSSAPGIFFGGMVPPRHDYAVNHHPAHRHPVPATAVPAVISHLSLNDQPIDGHSISSGSNEHEDQFIAQMLDHSGHAVGEQNGLEFDDFFSGDILKDLHATQREHTNIALRENCGPFLDTVVDAMAQEHLPFQHVDVWVPTYVGEGEAEELRLCHAGHATRRDIDSHVASTLKEYGEYGANFSFKDGCGMPGRVFRTGEYRWECRLDLEDPAVFERAGGARMYGVKTCLGIPVKTNVIGKIVVALYSQDDIKHDSNIVSKSQSILARYSPQPKWKLVIELGDGKVATGPASPTMPRPASSFASKNVASGASVASGTAHSVDASSLMDDPADGDLEHKIAAILGNHMPLAIIASPGGATTASPPQVDLLPSSMSLRLMLLRSKMTRTENEEELVAIIKRSYRGYTKERLRSEQEVAHLLAKDWQFLEQSTTAHARSASVQSGSFGGTPPVQFSVPAARGNTFDMPSIGAPASSEAYTSHVMQPPPTVSTHSRSGAPTVAPGSLAYVPPEAIGRLSLPSIKRGLQDSDMSLAHSGPLLMKKARMPSVDT